MRYKIIETGSKGNCYLFDEVLMVDAGVRFDLIKGFNPSYILFTHLHNDHFKIETIRKLFVYKNPRFLGPKTVVNELKKFGIDAKEIEIGKIYKLKTGHIISPVKAYHDIENVGYRIIKHNHKHFHITDTFTLKGISAKNYDSATIEANYHKETALRIIEEFEERGEYTHLKRALKTHLDVQEAIDFAKKNSIKKVDFVHIGDSTREAVEKTIKEYNQ